MITALLFIVGIILLIMAFKTFLIGNDMTIDQLKFLTQSIEEFSRSNRIVGREQKGCIFFDEKFEKSTKIKSIYLSMKTKGFVMTWNNGRSSNFMATNSEELQALLNFALALKKGLEEKVEESEVEQVGNE